jgi:hypothetical protein
MGFRNSLGLSGTITLTCLCATSFAQTLSGTGGPSTLQTPTGKYQPGDPISTAALNPTGVGRGYPSGINGGSGEDGGGLLGPYTYACGFEPAEASGNYILGTIDQQGNATGPQADKWDKSAVAAPASLSVVNTAPLLTGAQYLKIVQDPAAAGTTIAAFSPILSAAPPPAGPSGNATCSIQLRFNAPANFIGADYDIQPQAPSQGFLTARVKFSDFTNPGNISVLDNPGTGLAFINTGQAFPKNATFSLTICLDVTNDQIIYLLNGVQFYASQAGVFAGAAIEECLIRSDNFQQGNGDFVCSDQLSIVSGVAACAGLTGACCFSPNPGGGAPNCSLQTATNCTNAGGTFAGTGTTCTFVNCPPDECGPGPGGTCFVATPGIAGCDDEACCAIVCDTDPVCCDSDSGEWDAGCVALASAQCVPPGLCNQPDTNCQRPEHGTGQGAAGTLAATSDRNAGFGVADNFNAGGSPINTVCFSGIYVDFSSGGAAACDGAPPIEPIAFDAFEVRYFNDDAGGVVPGSLLSGPLPVTLTAKQDSGFTVGGGAFAIFEYFGTHANVAVTPGQCYWLEITNATDDTACFWLWETAPPGDSRSAQEDDGDGYDAGDAGDYDLAWCLNIPVGDLAECIQFGACCNNVTGECLDNVSALDCILPTQRFEADTLCANLNPPCGAGACCLPNGTCVNVSQAACNAQSGNWYVNIFCGTVLCSADDSCDHNNGEKVTNGPSPASQFAPNEFYAEAADNFTLKGNTGNDCVLTGLRWWVGHFNQAAGGCYACTNDASPCNPLDPAACTNVPANCQLVPPCTDTPDDYASHIRVTIYNDAFDPGQVKVVDGGIVGGIIIDDAGGPAGGGADCVVVGDCPAGSTCFDNDGDGDTECCATDELVAAFGPGNVIDLDVDLVISHTWQGDIVATLEKVGGPIVRLMRKPGDTDLHPTGLGADGYSADNFGDPLGLGPRLRIDDQAVVAINVYGGTSAGTANYSGPAISGGGGEAQAVLGAFAGLPKDGTWRIRVSDEFQTADSGELEGWGLIFVNGTPPTPKNPDGRPETVENPVPCTIDQDCIDLGGTTCGLTVPGECDDLVAVTPTGGHIGTVKYDLEVPFTWNLWDDGGTPQAPDDVYEIICDLGNARVWDTDSPVDVVLEKNKKNFIAVAPEVPFTGFYQTAWMNSANYDGNPARQIFDPLLPDWVFVGGGGWDQAFQLIGDKDCAAAGPCPWDTAPPGGNGDVGFADLTAVLINWGPCDGFGSPGYCPSEDCPWDTAPPGGNGDVGFADLTAVLINWGPC